MNRIFPYFFLLIMSLNVLAPLAEQLRGGDYYEMTEMGTTDADESDKTEKEEGKEKESFTYIHHTGLKPASDFGSRRKTSFPENTHPRSGRYASLPELPPEV